MINNDKSIILRGIFVVVHFVIFTDLKYVPYKSQKNKLQQQKLGFLEVLIFLGVNTVKR
jgi:hypothetical protein